jgi:hypothetical protein
MYKPGLNLLDSAYFNIVEEYYSKGTLPRKRDTFLF